MKIVGMRGITSILGTWTVSIACMKAVEFSPSPPIEFASTNVVTIGGVTCLSFSADVVDGELSTAVPVVVDGANISLGVVKIDYECPFEPWFCDPVTNRQSGTVVLGALPAGEYRLWVYEGLKVPPPTIVYQSFTVPESSEAALILERTAAGIEVTVNGPATAEYILESSLDLKDWTPAYRSLGAEFTYHTTSPFPQQFFRVAIANGTTIVE